MTPELHIFWLAASLFLSFFLQPGFLLIQTGFSRANSVVSVLMKNLTVLFLGSFAFFFIGYAFFFSPDASGFFLGTWARPVGEIGLLSALVESIFAAVPAAIVLGAVAGRTRFPAFAIFALLVCAFIYPVLGKWTSTGWLKQMGFHDFAGGASIHALAGWLALAGILIIGPRIGKFGPDKKPRAMPGHNILLAGLGLVFLWLGFSGIEMARLGEIKKIASVLVNVHFAGAAGALSALVFSWILAKKPDPSLTLNGALGGLVAVAAGSDVFSLEASIGIGLFGGILVSAGVIFLESVLHLDDPVGVVSIHALAGTWGLLAVGLFAPTGLFHGGGFGLLLTQGISTLR